MEYTFAPKYGKPICDFLLVINCNFSHICYRFRDIHA